MLQEMTTGTINGKDAITEGFGRGMAKRAAHIREGAEELKERVEEIFEDTVSEANEWPRRAAMPPRI